MLRLVVTASGTRPTEARTATYMAKSASSIMVAPDRVPPGRNELPEKRQRTRTAAMPNRSMT